MKRRIFLNVMLFIIFSAIVTSLWITEVNIYSPEFVFISFQESLPKKHNELVDVWTNYYSDKYEIPRGIVRGVLNRETKWSEDNDEYNAFVIGDKKSRFKSYGPGQIKLATAKSVWRGENEIVTEDRLLHDIRFNVETMCRILRNVYDDMDDRYSSEKHTWLATLTCYNMGHNGFLIKNNKKYNSYAYYVYGYYKKEDKI